MESGSEPFVRASGFGAVTCAAVAGGLLLGALFAGDGSDVGGVLPVGGAAVLTFAVALVLVAFGRLPVPRVGRSGAVLVAALVGLTLWIGITMSWSIVADRSWDAFNKAIAYCAFLGVGVVLAAVGRQWGARLTAWVLSAVLGVTLAWALLSKAVPSLDPEGDRVARLREPLGYWNALALLADVAIVVGLWLGSERAHRRPTRVLGALLVYVATLALMLTLSGAGVVVLLVAVGSRRSLAARTRRRLGRVLVALAVVVVLGGGAAASVSAADAVSSRECAEVVNDPSRLGSLDPNLRLCWWEEALDVYAHHGVGGAGAGSYEVARKRFRQDARNVVQPHSVPLQHLADGGVAGVALFVLVILAGAAVCVCALRRLEGAERAAAAAL